MRINLEHQFVTLDGEPLVQGNMRWTMGEVLKAALLAEPPPGMRYTPDNHIARYNLAREIRLRELRQRDGFIDDSYVEVFPALLAAVKTSIAVAFGPLIAGQALPLLEERAQAGQNAMTGAQQQERMQEPVTTGVTNSRLAQDGGEPVVYR